MTPPRSEFQNTPLWKAVSRTLRELKATREVTIATGDDYVIAFICAELSGSGVITPAALAPETGR